MSGDETRALAMAATPPPSLHGAEAEARDRRLALHAAMVDLEEALTKPAGDGAGWLQAVRASIDDMDRTLRVHVRDAEAPDGLLAQIREESPWLSPRADQLRNAHDDLLERSAVLTVHCRETANPDLIRDEAFQLIERVSRHRHQAADLLYDAYDLDLSAGD